MINLNMLNLNSSNIINEQLNECYEQLPDISDMTTEQTLQYMQVLYMAQFLQFFLHINSVTDKTAGAFLGCRELPAPRRAPEHLPHFAAGGTGY